MNEELEKNFLKEIKPLIDTYVRDRNQELDDLNIEGRRAIIEELKPRREQRLQNLKQEIYDKTKAFIKEAKEKSIEEKNSLIMEKERQLDEAKDNLRSKYAYSKNTIQLRNMAKTISDVAYKSADDMLQIAVNELRQANEAYKELQEEYNRTKKLDAIELLDERYRNIDFESEKGIEDIINIIKERQEKDLSNEAKDNKQTINNPRIHETSDDIKVTSIEELEKRRTQSEEDEIKQDEEQEVKTVFPRIHVDEVDIETRPKVLTRADLENEEEQDDSSLNEQDEVDEEKRKQEEEQMWEEYNKEQEEKREQEEEQMWEKYNEQQEKETKRVQEIDEQRNKNKEEKKKIREKKEEFFNNKEKFYEDLLKEDLPYQALKERLINTYTLPQLGKALNKKSLVEIYELYVKQVNKNIKDSMAFEEGLTQEEIDAKIAEKLDDEELKTTLSVRLEMLKERETRIKEVKQYFKNIEKQYGKDLLPNIYFKDKDRLMNRYIKWSKEIDFDFSQYCEEQFKILEEIANNTEMEAELGEIQDYKDLLEKIEKIREKKVELKKPQPKLKPQPKPDIQPKPVENAYKETKIVVEPYKDTITVYLKGQTEPYTRNNISELIEDGEKLVKSDRIQKGLIRGIKKGDLAILHVLQELEIATGQKLVDGYTWMYAKPNEIEKDKHPSPIDEIVYDFSKKDGKIQSQKMIKTMQKYAKTAENNGVAESIGRKKGIIEKGTNGIKSLFGKGTEKVLALGEGIKNFHPIGNAIENRRAKKYSKDRKVDGSKATITYNKWEDKQNKAYNDLIARMRQNAPTEEEQKAFIEKLKNEQVFNDRSKEERIHNVKEDEFYNTYGG